MKAVPFVVLLFCAQADAQGDPKILARMTRIRHWQVFKDKDRVAQAIDRNRLMVCRLRDTHAQKRAVRLTRWHMPGSDPHEYDAVFPKQCWFAVWMRVPRYIDGPGVGQAWQNCFQVKSRQPRRPYSHKPIANLSLYGENGEQGVYYWDFIRQRAVFPDYPIRNNDWVLLEMMVISDSRDGRVEMYVNADPVGHQTGPTSYNPLEEFPIFGCGHYGMFPSEKWTEVEFRDATVSINRNHHNLKLLEKARSN